MGTAGRDHTAWSLEYGQNPVSWRSCLTLPSTGQLTSGGLVEGLVVALDSHGLVSKAHD
jgi:hypothetical protein